MIETVAVTRYVTPLREGGSLPGLVEGDDLGTYVCKFRGAGQGVRVLVAEVIVSGLAARLGLRTPRLVALDLDPRSPATRPTRRSRTCSTRAPGSTSASTSCPARSATTGEAATSADTAARVLWLDAFTANVDRTWRNPNLLLWHDDLWVIDHGASLYFHHGWVGRRRRPRPVRRPGLGRPTTTCSAPTSTGCRRSTPSSQPDRRRRCAAVLAEVPDDWLEPVPGAELARRPARGVRRRSSSARLATRAWLPEASAA